MASIIGNVTGSPAGDVWLRILILHLLRPSLSWSLGTMPRKTFRSPNAGLQGRGLPEKGVCLAPYISNDIHNKRLNNEQCRSVVPVIQNEDITLNEEMNSSEQ